MTKKKNTGRVGAPTKESLKVKRPDGLREEQHLWLEKEAIGQNISKAQLKEQIIDWYMTAILKHRGDESIQDLFEVEVKNGNHKQK